VFLNNFPAWVQCLVIPSPDVQHEYPFRVFKSNKVCTFGVAQYIQMLAPPQELLCKQTVPAVNLSLAIGGGLVGCDQWRGPRTRGCGWHYPLSSASRSHVSLFT
jgi:hypothetical protein